MQQHRFYSFVGIHTFLIGLFPFYLPVFLWKLNHSISEISYFIAMTGLGYVVALWAWERVHRFVTLRHIIILSFLLELLLLFVILFRGRQSFFLLIAFLYGVYSCFFWITNRVLFFEMATPANSGRRFGNFQILVAVVLKAGVFCGGLMLDHTNYTWLFCLSLLVAGLGVFMFKATVDLPQLSRSLAQVKTVGISGLASFRDPYGSRFVFAIDGLFLFLESYFWVISLFIIVKESYWQLGMLAILLMLIFGLLFFFIKNAIDRFPVQIVYRTSVVLYVFSWFFRGILEEGLGLPVVFGMLVLITFSTSMFRLAFNKRFFDLARATTRYHYIFMKSYYSQLFIAILFTIIGLTLSRVGNTETAIRYTYLAAGFIALGYFLYRPGRQQKPSGGPLSQGT